MALGWKSYGQCSLAVKHRRDRYNEQIKSDTGVYVLAILSLQHLPDWFPSAMENIIERWLETIVDLVKQTKTNIERARVLIVEEMRNRNATTIAHCDLKEARDHALRYYAVEDFCGEPDLIDRIHSIRRIMEQEEMDKDFEQEDEENSAPEMSNDQIPSPSGNQPPTPSPSFGIQLSAHTSYSRPFFPTKSHILATSSQSTR